MARVVVVNFSSLDGVVQAPLSPEEDRDGDFAHGGWVVPYSDDTVDGFMEQTTVEAAGLLLGRRSYDILAAAWSQADRSEPAVAAMSRIPKYVVTSSREGLAWENSHVLDGDFAATVADLTDRTAGDLVVFGSATLVRGLAKHDLVDEYRLLVFPVLLGAGKRMFGRHSRLAHFDLRASPASASGVVMLTYSRSPPGR